MLFPGLQTTVVYLKTTVVYLKTTEVYSQNKRNVLFIVLETDSPESGCWSAHTPSE